jgi:hypothetical protein
MDVDVPAPPEVPVEQTLMGIPLNRLQWTNKASLLAPVFIVGDSSLRTERGFRFE